MRLTICFVVVLSLVLCAGCAKQEPAPAEPALVVEEAPAIEDADIASEDFESGEAEGAVVGGEDEADAVDSHSGS